MVVIAVGVAEADGTVSCRVVGWQASTGGQESSKGEGRSVLGAAPLGSLI